jgi:putative DNA primase/helicase
MPTLEKSQLESVQMMYVQNIYPAMLKMLADELGVTVGVLRRLGVGFAYHKQAYTIPERNASGEITGHALRYISGKKGFDEGGKHGLVYAINPSYSPSSRYQHGRHNWEHTSKEKQIVCPICGKYDWCMVSADNPQNPAAANCCRVSEGSVKPLGMGWLHILRAEGDLRSPSTLLDESQLPVLIVEGMSDVAAAMDLGFVAVGRPGASSCLAMLKDLPLAGRAIVVVGEHDAGAGEQGMEAAFRTLKKISPHVRKVMPPTGVKDLRAWVLQGATQLDIVNHIEKEGSVSHSEEVFDDDVAYTIAKKWMTTLMVDGYPKYRMYKGTWVQYTGSGYAEVDEKVVRAELYTYLEGKLCQKETPQGRVVLEPYRPTRAKLSDIFDAMTTWCLITEDPPVWLDGGYHPHPKDLIFLQNGWIDATQVRPVLNPTTPAYFTLATMPFDYDADADSPLWHTFLDTIFDGDADRKLLLQEWFGYNLVPDMSMEKLLILKGVPRSGKSTILDALRATLGNLCAETSFASLVSPFGFAPLIGKYAACIGDSKSPRATESDSALEKILQITGGDAVTVNRKYATQLAAVRLPVRFTFAMNDLPLFTDFSRALEARLMVIDFEKSFVGREDRTLKHRLKIEASQGKLVPWALEGLRRLRKRGQFTMPESSVAVLDGYSEIVNPVMAFANECIDFNRVPPHLTPETASSKYSPVLTCDLLWDIVISWAKYNNFRILSRAWFIRQFRATYPKIPYGQFRRGDWRGYGFWGVGLKEDMAKKYLGIVEK